MLGLMRALCYSGHGGSGFSFTRADVMAMGVGEAIDHSDWLAEQRRREADGIRRGG